SGRLCLSTGVGTVTTNTLQSAISPKSDEQNKPLVGDWWSVVGVRNVGFEVNNTLCNTSFSTSSVLSIPFLSSAIRLRLISNPTVGNFVPNNRASGKPT